MRRFTLAAALALSLLPSALAAKTFELGAPPVATVAIPDAWSPAISARGVEATTADDEIYVAVTVAAIENTEEAAKQAIAYLVSQGVKIDVTTQRQQAAQVNGMDAVSLGFSAKDEDDEDVEVSVSVLIVNPSTSVILTYWGSKDGERTYAAELGSILQSFTRK
jgi:hypothetical protein